MKDFLSHPETERIIREALREDIGGGDHTTLAIIPDSSRAGARCLMKESGIIAGVAMARKILNTISDQWELEVFKNDGEAIEAGEEVFRVYGKTRDILQAERLMLNIMQRMSGIATLTAGVVKSLEGLSCKVLDTRKTTPLIRHLEKWAVHIGGGVNHRFGLYDAVMIKDNHIDYAGSIPAAIQAVRNYLFERSLHIPVIVETRNMAEVGLVLQEKGVDRILLDNMTTAQLREAVEFIGGRIATEASGGITPETARSIGETGVDFLSMGALTHSVSSLDISLKAI